MADKDLDAVHLVTPIPLHERQTVEVLGGGKALRLHGTYVDYP